MVMKRFLVLLAIIGAGACNKPSADECHAAVVNVHSIVDPGDASFDVDGEVRRCRGGSSREAVACATSAKTRADLDACHFRGAKPAKP